MNDEKDNKSLADASIQATQGGWLQYWKSAVGLKLQGDMAIEWLPYLSLLKCSVIFIKETYDELKWSWNKANGVLTAKLGYEAKCSEEQIGEREWQDEIQSLESPLKIRNFLL